MKLQSLIGQTVVNRHRMSGVELTQARIGTIVSVEDNGSNCHPTVVVAWPDITFNMCWYDLALAKPDWCNHCLKDIVTNYSMG